MATLLLGHRWRWWLLGLLTLASLSAACAHKAAAPAAVPRSARAGDADELATWLNEHRNSPEDYVVKKFSDHDLVFLGEWHRIRHDPEFVQRLIPRLYEAGVFNLGIEFGNEEDQALVDALTTAERYDENLARRIMLAADPLWGYVEYIDLYRSAWRVNHELPAAAPRFRIVHLVYRADWSQLREKMTREQWQKVWRRGDYDGFMAKVILSQFVDRGLKAAIYCGMHHAFTRYRQPITDIKTARFLRFTAPRAGNIVRERIGDRAFTIALHAPWAARGKPLGEAWQRPAGGAIDAVMDRLGNRPVGFDTRGTPFGQLRDADTYYAEGHPDFRLGEYCDGWVYSMPFARYRGVTVDPKFITSANLASARAGLTSLQERTSLKTVEDLMREMRNAAYIPSTLKRLH